MTSKAIVFTTPFGSHRRASEVVGYATVGCGLFRRNCQSKGIDGRCWLERHKMSRHVTSLWLKGPSKRTCLVASQDESGYSTGYLCLEDICRSSEIYPKRVALASLISQAPDQSPDFSRKDCADGNRPFASTAVVQASDVMREPCDTDLIVCSRTVAMALDFFSSCLRFRKQ